jgi:S1-C subfamily serine protease
VLPDDVARVGLTSAVGALVSLVVPGGPADVAGLKVDDVIVEFDNKPITGPEKLRWMASLAGIGNEVPVKVQRATRLFEVRVRLNALPTTSRMPQLIPFP